MTKHHGRDVVGKTPAR